MKNRTRALAVLIAVLLVGFLLGATGFHLWERRSDGAGFLSQSRGQGFQNRLVALLQLTPEQEVQLKAIFQETRGQINTTRTEMEGKMDAIRTQANARIGSMLNEEQKKKFEQYLKESESRRFGGYHGDRGNRAVVR